MYDIGFVGLGKMGFPVSLAYALSGHKVWAYDISRERIQRYKDGNFLDHYEVDITSKYLDCKDRYRFVESLDELVKNSEVIMVAVQTPHREHLGGTYPFNPLTVEDFDYSSLCIALQSLYKKLLEIGNGHSKTVVIQSTVLPGTTRGILKTLVKLSNVDLLYVPCFIAMGTAIQDFLNPEFLLVGTNSSRSSIHTDRLVDIHKFLYTSTVPVEIMSYESAEMAKMMYNTFIGFKVIFANTVMQLADNIPNANAAHVLSSLRRASKRVVSPSYLYGGMGDGGPCHPRDNLALSWLSRKYLDYDIFGTIMSVRDSQAKWIVDMLLPGPESKVILGSSYKESVCITDGSASILIRNMLLSMGLDLELYVYDEPVTDIEKRVESKPSIYLIGTRDIRWRDYPYVYGSTIIDPWGIIESIDGVSIRTLGIGL